jgi:hypothetical protein
MNSSISTFITLNIWEELSNSREQYFDDFNLEKRGINNVI